MTTSPQITTQPVIRSQQEITSLVNEIISQHYQASIAKARLLHPRYARLLQAMHALAAAGGKRMRPYLAVMTYESYGGSKYRDMCTVGAALEQLHAAMLMHDDIIDRDYTRYGVKNVSGQYRDIYNQIAGKDAAHYADSAAILAGDISLSAAYQLVLDTGFSAKQKLVLQRLLGEAVFRVCGGELIDTEAALYQPQATDPLLVSGMKTAHYSFVTPMLCGSLMAGAVEDEIEKLTDLGMKLGVAFQLADDILGIYGDQAVTGKSNTGDIREGRRTWLAGKARELASTDQLKIIDSCYGNPGLDTEQADSIRRVFAACGALAACQNKITGLADECRIIVASLALPISAKDNFYNIITKATQRDR